MDPYYLLIITYSTGTHGQIEASFNYCVLGGAPLYLDPGNLSPENVPLDSCLLVGETTTFPKGYMSEIRADWKFMKANRSSSEGSHQLDRSQPI